MNLSDRPPFSSWQDQIPPTGFFPSPLGPDERAFFDTNGYLVLDRVIEETFIEALKQETVQICRNAEGKVRGVAPSTPEQSDDEVMGKILCIHFPHKIAPVMLDAIHHPSIVQALTTVIGPDVKAMQSMLFIKAAGKPGQAWHQDEDYIPTRDRSLTGAWIALDDATVENGCLWVIPGSHRPGVLWKMEWHGDRRFDCALQSNGFPYTAADEVPVEVRRGSVVLFNGYTLHRSLPNHAKSGYRRALVNHYMSASSLLPWNKEEGTPVALSDHRDIVMVAGVDPYAWKPVADLYHPHVRASGEGGCHDGRTGAPRPYNS